MSEELRRIIASLETSLVASPSINSPHMSGNPGTATDCIDTTCPTMSCHATCPDPTMSNVCY